MTSPLYHLVYMSRAAPGLTDAEIDEILAVSRARNQATGITGLLLYARDSFIQVLEGSEAEVEGVFRSIKRDARHSWVTVLIREEIQQRDFLEWTMGFQRLPAAPPTEGVFHLTSPALAEKLRSATLNVQDMILGFAECLTPPPSARRGVLRA